MTETYHMKRARIQELLVGKAISTPCGCTCTITGVDVDWQGQVGLDGVKENGIPICAGVFSRQEFHALLHTGTVTIVQRGNKYTYKLWAV